MVVLSPGDNYSIKGDAGTYFDAYYLCENKWRAGYSIFGLQDVQAISQWVESNPPILWSDAIFASRENTTVLESANGRRSYGNDEGFRKMLVSLLDRISVEKRFNGREGMFPTLSQIIQKLQDIDDKM
jgi:hypothetical protein